MVLLVGHVSEPAVPCPLNVRELKLDPQTGPVVVIFAVAMIAFAALVGVKTAVTAATVESEAPPPGRVMDPDVGIPFSATDGSLGIAMVKVAGALPLLVIWSDVEEGVWSSTEPKL
jgi:hypothetical protein